MSGTVELVAALGDRVRPLRRAEYERLVAAGAFAQERVELLRGTLVRMTPQDPAHADAVQWLARVVAASLPAHLDLRVQLPLAAGDDGEPEPDLAVVRAGRYRDAHPVSALLVVEVARGSHAVDLGPKVSTYAEAGVAEYWVVDLRARAVVVFREPEATGYRVRGEHRGGVLRPGPVPEVAVNVDELFA
ncbi:MAG: Uma2 family endonuclease [Actinomycetota bacterium]|nr:Uma2 family endonuclease [Actinomycetota bacterium]